MSSYLRRTIAVAAFGFESNHCFSVCNCDDSGLYNSIQDGGMVEVFCLSAFFIITCNVITVLQWGRNVSQVTSNIIIFILFFNIKIIIKFLDNKINITIIIIYFYKY